MPIVSSGQVSLGAIATEFGGQPLINLLNITEKEMHLAQVRYN